MSKKPVKKKNSDTSSYSTFFIDENYKYVRKHKSIFSKSSSLTTESEESEDSTPSPKSITSKADQICKCIIL